MPLGAHSLLHLTYQAHIVPALLTACLSDDAQFLDANFSRRSFPGLHIGGLSYASHGYAGMIYLVLNGDTSIIYYFCAMCMHVFTVSRAFSEPHGVDERLYRRRESH